MAAGDLGNIALADLVRLLTWRRSDFIGGHGSHRVFGRAYQVRQVASLVRRYDLRLEEE